MAIYGGRNAIIGTLKNWGGKKHRDEKKGDPAASLLLSSIAHPSMVKSGTTNFGCYVWADEKWAWVWGLVSSNRAYLNHGILKNACRPEHPPGDTWACIIDPLSFVTTVRGTEPLPLDRITEPVNAMVEMEVSIPVATASYIGEFVDSRGQPLILKIGCVGATTTVEERAQQHANQRGQRFILYHHIPYTKMLQMNEIERRVATQIPHRLLDGNAHELYHPSLGIGELFTYVREAVISCGVFGGNVNSDIRWFDPRPRIRRVA